VNVSYGDTSISATGGSGAISYSATSLPPGLSINSATGAITGTPTTAGTFTFPVSAAGAISGAASAGYTIEIAAPPQLSIGDVSQSEGNAGTTTFAFTVSLDKPAAPGGTTFDIATADGTASAPSDYVAKSLSGQTIPAGASSVTFTVTVKGDADVEPNETFFVNVINVTGATVLDSQSVGTIVNDDAAAVAPTITNITPNTGSTAGGTTVTISGTDFTGATAVTFAGTGGGNLTIVNDTTITVTTPAHAAGAVAVAVTTPGGTDTLNSGFTYEVQAPTVTVSASDNNPALGASVTFTATLAGGASPTGTVTFKDGAVTLGTGTISGTTATFDTATLAVGTHSITAEYGGDTNNAAATSAALTVTVGQVAPTVTVSASDSNPALGASVTFTATLAGGASPTGSVTFKDGATTLGTGTISGTTATFDTAALTVGAHSITAEYGGDTNNAAATSAAAAVTVAAPTFTFSPAAGALPEATANTPYSQSVTASASGTATPISYAVTSGALPSGLTLDPATGAIAGTPTLAGSYSFTITVTDSAIPPNSGAARYTVTVKPAVTFTFSPAGGALMEAMPAEDYSQRIVATGGTGALTYSLASGSLPAGMTLNVSTGELTGPLDETAEVKTYSFTIEVRDGSGATGKASFTLTVKERVVSVTDKTIDMSAGGTPANVNLEHGATGGPFADADWTFVEPANAGTASIVRGEFAQASGSTPLGWYLKFIPNPGFSGTVQVGFKLTSALGTSDTGIVTYKLGYDPAKVAEEIDGLVHGFVQTRQSMIASTIKVPGLLDRRQMENAVDPVTARMMPSEEGMTAGFSTSLAQLEAARDGAEGVAGGYSSPFNIWIDGTLMAHNREENGGKWGGFGMISVGADYLLSEKALIGLSFHFDRMTDPTDDDAELTGNGWLAGPYASFEIGKGVFWDTSLLYGGSANDIDTAFWDGSFDTKRWMIDTAIKGEWQLDEVTVLTPKLRAIYFNEKVEDYAVQNATDDELTTDGFDAEQFRVSLGAEIARSFSLENGATLTPTLGVTGGYAGLDGSGVYGSLTAGLTLETADFWMLEASLLLNIEGDGQKSVGGRARASKRF
ncbi:MAG: putative Ig domain-containing protein, partial [Shinella sp.]